MAKTPIHNGKKRQKPEAGWKNPQGCFFAGRFFAHARAFMCLFLIAFLSGAPAFSQEEVHNSTAAAKPQQKEMPLLLTFAMDRRDSRIWLDYSVRWDFSDLAEFRPGLKTISNGLSAITNWDITENTRVKYYGLRANPWRIFIAREKVQQVRPSVAGVPLTASGNNSPVYKKHLRLSFSPLVDDFKRDLDENLRSVLLQNSLKATGSQWARASARDKKAFFRDVLSLEIWDLPVLDATKDGLEYISR